MKSPKNTGMALAIAAAGLMGTSTALLSTTASAAASDAHCYGVNVCKGHNDCKVSGNDCKAHNSCKTDKNNCKGKASCSSAGNSCAGKASCKGTGFVKMSTKACADIGGTAGK